MKDGLPNWEMSQTLHHPFLHSVYKILIGLLGRQVAKK